MRDIIEIEINNQIVFCVYDREPKDNNLYRNFNACYKIIDLMKQTFDAGKNGKTFDLLYKETDAI